LRLISPKVSRVTPTLSLDSMLRGVVSILSFGHSPAVAASGCKPAVIARTARADRTIAWDWGVMLGPPDNGLILAAPGGEIQT
jgi:hypothetical protein